MGAGFVVPPAEEDRRVRPPLIDPLQVADGFATHLDIEVLCSHARITASVARTNPFGDLERTIVARTVLTLDDLMRELEAALVALLDADDPAVQAKALAMMERLLQRMAEDRTRN